MHIHRGGITWGEVQSYITQKGVDKFQHKGLFTMTSVTLQYSGGGNFELRLQLQYQWIK